MQLYATLIAGATAVVRSKFRSSRWIHDLVEYGATATNLRGVVIVFVLQQEPSELDIKHRLRALGVAPNPVELDPQLRRRFGFKDVIGMYGMTH